MAKSTTTKLQKRNPQCQHCGIVIIPKIFGDGYEERGCAFYKRKYCSLKCFGESQRGVWRVANPQSMAAHHRARRIFIKLGICELCREHKKTEIHHKDRDWRNNDIQNLQELCHRCHMILHRHLKRKKHGKK